MRTGKSMEFFTVDFYPWIFVFRWENFDPTEQPKKAIQGNLKLSQTTGQANAPKVKASIA